MARINIRFILGIIMILSAYEWALYWFIESGNAIEGITFLQANIEVGKILIFLAIVFIGIYLMISDKTKPNNNKKEV